MNLRLRLENEHIKKRLLALSRSDQNRSVFGASVHGYVLNPPLNVAEIEAFEQKHGVRLPDDYRRFITEIGNGGFGPYYGVFQFGHEEDGRWGEHFPFGDPGSPFPHPDAWNLSDEFWDQEPDIQEGMPREEEDRLLDDWDKLLEERYWNPSIMNGAIPICHKGCGLLQWLVIHGNQRGFVWDDLRADHGGIAPVTTETGDAVSFTDWFVDWLEKIEAGEGRVPVPSYFGMVSQPSSRRRKILTLLMLVVAGVLIGLAREYFR